MRIGRLRCLKVVCIGIEIVANVLRTVVAQCHGNVTGVLDEGTRPITAISSEIAREDGLIVGDMGLDPLLCESEIHGRGPNQRRVQGLMRYVASTCVSKEASGQVSGRDSWARTIVARSAGIPFT